MPAIAKNNHLGFSLYETKERGGNMTEKERQVLKPNIIQEKSSPKFIYRLHKLRKGYFASISHVDNEIGRVLDWLKTNDLPRNTITVLTSDHGFLLGEQGSWKKEILFGLATQVPLMIRVPEVTEKGMPRFLCAL